jgi:hypothetical protein
MIGAAAGSDVQSLTAILIAILALVVLGIPIALSVDRNARGALLAGTSFLYGSGAIFLELLALSVVHVRWTLVSATITALLVSTAAAVVARMRAPVQPTRPPVIVRPHLFDGGTLLTLVGYAVYATLAPLWEWDFWAIWGLKARVFLEAGGIDWRFLGSPLNAFAHVDYPQLVPLNFDLVALIGGEWSDRWLGLLCVAWSLAIVLIVRALAARETTPFFGALITFGLSGLAVSRYVGLAEGALIAFGSAGVLFVRSALDDDDPAPWRHAALMLGFAANCKNEGLALLAAVTIALIANSLWRDPARIGSTPGARNPLRRAFSVMRHLIPAYLLALPWLLLRATHALPTDIAGGSAGSRLLARLPYAHQILGFLMAKLYQPWLWIAILAGILIAPSVARRREHFVFFVTAIQFVFYVGAYLSTPHNLRWHVLSSWPRLTGQIALPIAFVVLVMLANSLQASQDAAHAEARPDE